MGRLGYPDKAKFNVTIAQLIMELNALVVRNVKNDARVLPRQPMDHRKYDTLRQGWAAADSHLTCGGVGEKLDILQSLINLIEGGDAAFEQSAAVLRRLNAPRAAVEQSNAERMFSVGDRSEYS
jgi:hypothetical protein